MTYEKTFTAVKKAFLKADTKKFNDEFAFQFNITGDGEGIFYASFKDGAISVEPYDYKDRDVIFTSDAKTLVAVAEGKASVTDAINGGKLAVDGNYELAKKLSDLALAPTEKASKPKAKSAAKEAKPTAKTEPKPVVKEAKPLVKAEKKPAVKTEAKPAAKVKAAPAAKAVKK